MKNHFSCMALLSLLVLLIMSCSGNGSSPNNGDGGDSTGNTEPVVLAYEFGLWASTGGPPGGLGYDIRMDPRNPDVLYVTDAWAGAIQKHGRWGKLVSDQQRNYGSGLELPETASLFSASPSIRIILILFGWHAVWRWCIPQ